MQWLDKLERRFVTLTRRIASLAVLGMLALSLLTISDVILRAFFNAPVPGFFEVSELIIAVVITASFAAGLIQRNNLTVDFFRKPLGREAEAIFGAIGAFAILIFIAIIGWRFGIFAWTLQARNQITPIIHWPVAPFWWAATFLLAICVPVQLIVTLVDSYRAILIFAGRNRAQAPAAEDGLDIVPNQHRRRRLKVIGKIAAVAAGVGLIYWLMVLSSDAEAMGALAGFGFLAMWLPMLFLIPIGVAMGFAGLTGAALLVGADPAMSILAIQSASFLSNLDLAVLPLFLMMGSFATAAGLSSDAYRFAQAVIGHRRGGLAMATIGGCAGFGAVTGSSLATAATIGRIALPQMRGRGYSAELATGSVAAGGTLGALIPPSGMMVIYAVLTESSIGAMFVAAVVPALLAVLLYMLTVSIFVRVAPGSASIAERAPLRERIIAVRGSWGVFVLFGVVMGGLYGGIFTATEAAAVGAGGAFLFALLRGKLKGGEFWRVLAEVAANTAMIYLLLFGAIIFAFFIGVTQLPQALVGFVEGLDVAPLVVILLILLLYLALGCVMDPVTTLLITVPVVAPLVASLGFDLIWWGIITVVVIEIGLITPPIGMNVFVIKAVAEDVPMATIFRGIMPFMTADLVKLLLLVLFPFLILWLPQTMR